jgi:hypothetical protein
MTFIKVKKIGDELVLSLSEDARAMLEAKDGDTLMLRETPSGALELVKPDPKFEERLKRGRSFLKKYKSTFKALAK